MSVIRSDPYVTEMSTISTRESEADLCITTDNKVTSPHCKTDVALVVQRENPEENNLQGYTGKD